jgi:hypothetical protein
MLVKCYHHLYPLANNGSAYVEEEVVNDYSLDLSNDC